MKINSVRRNATFAGAKGPTPVNPGIAAGAGDVSQRMAENIIGNSMRNIEQREREVQSLDAARKATRLQNQMNEEIQKSSEDLTADNYDGFTERTVKGFDKEASSILNSPDLSEYEKNRLKEKFIKLRSRAFQQASKHEARARITSISSVVDEQINANSADVFHDPGVFEDSFAEVEETIDSQETTLPAEIRENMKAGAKKLIAESSALGMISQNPRAAVAAIDEGVYDDYLDGKTLARLRGAAATAASQRESVQTYELKERMRASIASMQSTGEPVGIDEASIEEALGKDAVLKYRDDMRDASEVFGYTAGMPTQGISTIHSLVRSSAPSPGDPDFHRKQKVYETVQKRANQIIDARLENPAAAAAQTPEIREMARLIEQEYARGNQERAQKLQENMVERSMIVQGQLEVPPHMRKPLDVNSSEALVSELQFLPSDQAEGMLERLKEHYGGMYDSIMSQLNEDGLNPGYSVLAWTSGTPVSNVVKQAIDMKPEELKALFPDKAAYSNMELNVKDAMEPFISAVAAGASDGSRVKQLKPYIDVVTKVAGIYATQNGFDETDAAEKAANEIINDRIDIYGALYIPKEYGDTETIEDNLYDIKRDTEQLQRFNPIPFGSVDPGLSPAQRKAALVDTASSEGVWVTNEEGDGAYLAVDINGRKTPLINAEGWRFERSFDDVANMQTESKPLIEALFGPAKR